MDGQTWPERVGNEGIYKVNTHRLIESAVLELQIVHEKHMPDLTSEQESNREQICARTWQECEEALADFSLDEQIDKKPFKRGRMAAKVAAKLNLRERLPELHDDKEWAKRKKIVDDHNVHGEYLSYWDHLSTDEWMPMFNTEFKEQAYATDFNQVYEDYLGPVRASFAASTHRM